MRRRIDLGSSHTDAKESAVSAIRRTLRRQSHRFASIGPLLLAALVSACGSTQGERVGSGAAIGAGAGAAVGVVASPAIVGGVLVGAAAGGVAGLAVHEEKSKGAAEPRGVVLRQLLRQQARLWNLSDPILTESAEVCQGRTRPSFGFVAWTRWDIDGRYRIASMDVYRLDDRLRVVHVLPGSPAAGAGLLAGDEIERIGPHDMPAGQSAGAALGLVVEREAVVGTAQTFRIRRGAQRLTLEIMPRRQCAIDLVVTDSDLVNAVNHGRTIYVTDGLMRFFPDDRDLAAVVAHFVGHALLEHGAGGGEPSATGTPDAQAGQLQRAVLGETDKVQMMTSGVLPGARPYTAEQEIQADRAALELLARAEYAMEPLVEVWQRLAERQPGTVLLGDFHPPSAERRSAAQDLLIQVRRPDETDTTAPGS